MCIFWRIYIVISILFVWILSSCSVQEYFTYREAALLSIENDERAKKEWNIQTPLSVEDIKNTISSEVDDVLSAPNDEIRNRIIDMIDKASKNVDLTVYLLTDKPIIESLIRAKKRGIEVRIILEKEVYQIPNANRTARDLLASAGVEVLSKADDGFNFVHTKTLLVDDSYVISTGNYTKSSFSKNREFYIFGKNENIRKTLSEIFLADFYRNTLSEKNIPINLVISPINAREKIEFLLRSAKKEITIYAQSLSDQRMLDILLAKKQEWVRVRICLGNEKKPSDSRIKTELFLSRAGIPVVSTTGPMLHAKTIKSDNFLLIGSQNYTTNSLDNNREIGKILPYENYAKMYRDTMEKDCKWPQFAR